MKRRGVSLMAAMGVLALTFSAQAADPGFRARASTLRVPSAAAIAEDVKAEVEFGRDVAARILGRHRLFEHEVLVKYVNLVGQAVAAHGDRPELTYRFAILDTDSINAYAAPGGYIFITRGALAHLQDEAELAAVLAHEVAHVSRRHIVTELNIHAAEKAPEAGVAHLLAGATETARIAFTQAVDKAVALLFDSGLKQEDELEADRVGTLLLANTGYDATALRSYVARLQQQQGESMKMLHATHPPFDKRLAQLDELIAAEQLGQPGAPRVQQRFHNHTH